MPPKLHPMPPLPEQPEKMLYEYSCFQEIPEAKKPFVRRFLKRYLDWVISQPQFWEDEQDAEIQKAFS